MSFARQESAGPSSSQSTLAAQVPLPETPSSSVSLPSTIVKTVDSLAAPGPPLAPTNASVASGIAAPIDYFSNADVASVGGASAVLPLAVISPTPELPSAAADPRGSETTYANSRSVLELPPIFEDLNSTDAAVIEEQQPRIDSAKEMLHVEPMPVSEPHVRSPLLIGISGCSSSGKTTLAHLLSSVLPATTPCFFVHEDDFFVPKHLLVPDTNGDIDGDCPCAINIAALVRMLEYAKREGRLPLGFRSSQLENERVRALDLVGSKLLENLQVTMASLSFLEDGRPVGIIDGSLLYHDGSIREILDVMILLRCSQEKSKQRYLGRLNDNEQEVERHFRRTETYFDDVVWKNFVQEHEALFQDGDVEGRPVLRICDGIGIAVQPDLDATVDEVFRWAVDAIIKKASDLEKDREIGSPGSSRHSLDFCDCGEGFVGRLRQMLLRFV